MKKSNLYAGPGINANTLDAVSLILENLFNSGYDRQTLETAISWKLKEIKQSQARKTKKQGVS